MTRNHNLHSFFSSQECTELQYNLRTPLALSAIAGTLLTGCGSTVPPVIDDNPDTTSSSSSSLVSSTMQSSLPSSSSRGANPQSSTSSTSSQKDASQYRDGTYTTVAQYRAPSGEESINVSFTIKNDVITDANYAGTATVGKSANYQQAFGGGYKQYVVGKKIDALSLDIVSGASLTTKGFMVAVEQVKKMAR